VGATGVVLGAWYLLTMLQRGFFGPLKEPAHNHNEPPVRDLNLRELAALAPILILCLGIGVYPQPLLETIRPDVDAVAGLYEKAGWMRENRSRQAADDAPRGAVAMIGPTSADVAGDLAGNERRGVGANDAAQMPVSSRAVGPNDGAQMPVSLRAAGRPNELVDASGANARGERVDVARRNRANWNGEGEETR